MFPERLRKLRKEKGLTQSDLGNIFGFGDSTISQYESGKRMPDSETLLKIANYFDVSVDYLLGRTNVPHQVEIIAGYHDPNNLGAEYSEEARKEIDQFLEFIKHKYKDYNKNQGKEGDNNGK